MANPFLGPSYQLASRPASVQRTVNLIPVPLEPGNERTDWVFKDVPGLTEVTFTFPPPPLDYVFLLHFENNLTDDCGNTFEADGGLIAEAGLPNSFTYTSDSPAMGAYSGRCPGTNNHIRSETWDDLQLAAFDWQIEGFIRLRNVGGGVGGPIISTGSLQTGGATVGPLPANGQFALTISAGGVFTCDYATAIGNSELTVVGSPAAVAEDVWQHFALVSDATSTRLYSGPVSGGVSTLIAESVGVRPYAGAYDALQRFFIICEYTGGIPPLETYTSRFHGDIDELRMLDGVTYVGSSVLIPVVPFSLEDTE